MRPDRGAKGRRCHVCASLGGTAIQRTTSQGNRNVPDSRMPIWWENLTEKLEFWVSDGSESPTCTTRAPKAQPNREETGCCHQDIRSWTGRREQHRWHRVSESVPGKPISPFNCLAGEEKEADPSPIRVLQPGQVTTRNGW